MDHFVEIWLLFLINQASNYGYALLEQLKANEVVPANFSFGSLYRVLRTMEKAGCIVSKWVSGSNGPNRRFYTATSQGKKELEKWISIIYSRHLLIQKLLALHDQFLENQSREV